MLYLVTEYASGGEIFGKLLFCSFKKRFVKNLGTSDQIGPEIMGSIKKKICAVPLKHQHYFPMAA